MALKMPLVPTVRPGEEACVKTRVRIGSGDGFAAARPHRHGGRKPAIHALLTRRRKDVDGRPSPAMTGERRPTATP